MQDFITRTIWAKYNGLLRYCLAHTLSKNLPLFIINEYPKSGGSWIGEMLGEALAVPFPRNQLPVLRSSILHGHMMHSWNMHNVLLVWRDGRDVLISLYFHSVFENDRQNARLVAQCRADLGFSDYRDIRANLAPFMEYVFVRKRHPRMSWMDFVNRWVDSSSRYVQVRYEDMRARPIDELQRISHQLSGKRLDRSRAESIVDAHSFAKLSGRAEGVENAQSFMRKGIVGDWKNYFDQDARVLFCQYAGKELIKLGYEQDNLWVENPSDLSSQYSCE